MTFEKGELILYQSDDGQAVVCFFLRANNRDYIMRYLPA